MKSREASAGGRRADGGTGRELAQSEATFRKVRGFLGAGADQAGQEQAATGNQCGKTFWKVSPGKEETWQQRLCVLVAFFLAEL